MYHTHAASTCGALVVTYCFGRRIWRARGRYDVPNTMSSTEKDNWTERSEVRVFAAVFNAVLFAVIFAVTSVMSELSEAERSLEK